MKRVALPFSSLAGLILILITACGGAAPAPTATTAPPPATTAPVATTVPPDGNGNASEGQAIFTGSGGCGACHTIEGVSVGLLGPDLTHIGTDAATRKPDFSAAEYITESIRDPEAFIPTGVERATPGIMVSALTDALSDAEVAAMVEFLLAQK